MLDLVPCWYHGVVVLNNQEIVILGGRNSTDDPLNCVHVFSTESDMVKRVAVDNLYEIVPGHFASVKVRKDVVLTLSCKLSSLIEYDRV